jgi:CheY-like chemotaxis protein
LSKFTLNSGEAVALPQSGFLKVAVIDTGTGMSNDQLARVFGENVQFNANELQAGQGSGLGLFIAKGIMKQLGGSLAVFSEGLGHGTTFTMTLPLYHVPDTALPESLKHQQQLLSEHSSDDETAVSPKHPAESLRVLVVDDAAINRKLLMRLLNNQGHVCEEAEDGLRAVEQVENAMKEGKRYDSILLDYEMPVMNGPTAAKEIRVLGCDSLIVGITGNLLPEDVSFFKACGANSVLPKPVNLRDLVEIWVAFGIVALPDRSSRGDGTGSVMNEVDLEKA